MLSAKGVATMPAFALHVHSTRRTLDALRLWRPNTFAFRLALIGSTIVDFDEIGVLPRVHGRSRDFLRYLQRIDPKYVPLAVGMVMHEELDALMDKDFVEPNEHKAHALLKKADARFGSVKLAGHFLLDQSLDAWILRREPQLVSIMHRARRVRKGVVRKMAFHLTSFFGGDYNAVLGALLAFRDIDLTPFETLDGLSEVFVKYLFLRSQQARISRRYAGGLMSRLHSNIAIGLAYGRFLLHERTARAKALIERVHDHFGPHEKTYGKAERALTKSTSEFLAAHGIIIK